MDTTAKSTHSHVCVRAKTYTKDLRIVNVEVSDMSGCTVHVCMYDEKNNTCHSRQRVLLDLVRVKYACIRLCYINRSQK